jgi:hypothetical protein
MAEERQGEARADDGLSTNLGANLGPSLAMPALQQAAVAAMGGLAASAGTGTLAGFNPLQGLGGLNSISTLNTLQVEYLFYMGTYLQCHCPDKIWIWQLSDSSRSIRHVAACSTSMELNCIMKMTVVGRHFWPAA